jgi:hypothetical protein
MAIHAGGLMVEARFAYESGDVERAKRICAMILQLQPGCTESEEAAAYLGRHWQARVPSSAPGNVAGR